MFSLPVTRSIALTSSSDLLVRPGADAVHRGDQQFDEGVSDLPQPGVQQRREQGQHQRLGVIAQVRRGLHRGSGPPGGHHARGDVGAQLAGQAHRPDRA